MAEWSLKSLYYLNYYSTQKDDVLGFGISYITIGYLLFNFHKLKVATSKIATSNMAFHFCIASKHHFVSILFIGPAAYVEGNKDHLRSSQPPRIHCRCGRTRTRTLLTPSEIHSNIDSKLGASIFGKTKTNRKYNRVCTCHLQL